MTNNPDQKNVLLLLTRPLDGNERFCSNIEHLLNRCEILDNPIQKIEFLSAPSKIKNNAVLIFTSINGLRAAERYKLTNKKCFVVGENTKKIAKSLRYEVLGFARDQEQLVKLIKSNKTSECLVHIRGRHTVGNLCSSLNGGAVSCIEIVGYKQEPLEIKKQIFKKVQSNRPVILPIFSARTAKLLKNNLDLTGFYVVAISEAVEKILADIELGDLLISEQPDLQSMQEATLAILRRLIKFDSSTY